MGVIGNPRDFHQKWKFLVEVDGLSYAGFKSATGLSVEAAVIEHSEGGAIVSDKQPGRLTHEPIVLERGATLDRELYDWFSQVADSASNGGLVAPLFKREVDIVQQGRDGSELVRYRLRNAWPSKYEPGEWDNDSDEVVMEKVTLQHDGFTRI